MVSSEGGFNPSLPPFSMSSPCGGLRGVSVLEPFSPLSANTASGQTTLGQFDLLRPDLFRPTGWGPEL